MSTRPGMTLAPQMVSPFIEQVTGTDKGKIFELGSTQLTIGRARENDIIVQSEAVSRLHARLIQSEGAWFIRDNGSKNGILVNGKNCRESWLENGDIVQVGDFVFRFNDPTSGQGAPAEAAPEPELYTPAPEMAEPVAAPGDFGTAPVVAKKKAPNRRVLIYGTLLLLGGLYYVSSSDTPSDEKKEPEGPTLARDFKLSEEPNLNPLDKPKKLAGLEDPILKEAEKAMAGLDWTNTSLRQAEQFFKKGQREYLNRNYHRAIEFFQTSLQLYRGHLLAERYLKRSVYEAELEAKNQMALGIQYYTSLQYQRAMYHFQEVITLMAHRPTEPIAGEAGKYIEQCKKVLKAAELFP
jgi:pSer/pThr/pTyr-binding forkhead associated (FHA) protein